MGMDTLTQSAAARDGGAGVDSGDEISSQYEPHLMCVHGGPSLQGPVGWATQTRVSPGLLSVVMSSVMLWLAAGAGATVPSACS